MEVQVHDMTSMITTFLAYIGAAVVIVITFCWVVIGLFKEIREDERNEREHRKKRRPSKDLDGYH